MRRRGVSTATSLIALIVIIFLVAGVLAYTSTVHFRNIKQVRGAIGQAAETHSELLRIYIHPKNESDPSSEPMVTIFNPSPREVMLKQIVAVKRDGGVLKAGMLPQSLSIPPSSKTTIRLSALGLQFNSFLDAAQTLKVAYLITARGNSFGSTFGPPPPEILEGQVDYEENSSIEIFYYNVETEYNFTFTDFLNITGGDAYIAVNSYVLDKEGKILGGIENGQYFTSGLINPGSIPWDGAGLYYAPIWGYFQVPEATEEFEVHYSDKFGGGYLGKARLQYIELIAIYPQEWYSLGSGATAPAPYMRYGEQTVENRRTYNLLLPYSMNYPRSYTTTGRILTERSTRTFTVTSKYETGVGYSDWEAGTKWIETGEPVKPIKMEISLHDSLSENYAEISILNPQGIPIPLKLVSWSRGRYGGGCSVKYGIGYRVGYAIRCEKGADATVEIRASDFMDKFAIKYKMYDRVKVRVYYEKKYAKTHVYTATLPVPVGHAAGYIQTMNTEQTSTTVTWTTSRWTKEKSVSVSGEGSGEKKVGREEGDYISINEIKIYVPQKGRIKVQILDQNGQPIRLKKAKYCWRCSIHGDWVECNPPYYSGTSCYLKPAESKKLTEFTIKYWDAKGYSYYYGRKKINPYVRVSYRELIIDEYTYVFEGDAKTVRLEEKVLSAGEMTGGDHTADILASWEISYPDSLLYPIKVEYWASGRTPSGDSCSRFHSFKIKKIYAEIAEKDGWYPALHVRGELVATSDYKYCNVRLYVKVLYARAILKKTNLGGPTAIVIDRVKLVQPFELVKIDAPIVLINRIYYIDKDVQPPPPSSGGGKSPKIPAGCKVVKSYCEKRAPKLAYEEGGLSLYVGDAVCVYYYECGFELEAVVR
ncbi:hypothetical protein DRO58_00760 [Candidatus Bathyarchaeota archaeon]|nr:MAG: hypothetical protein DRO58_00760 [Candidatus Bathyarchaeota archaeon]